MSVLISSDFLQMHGLVRECLGFLRLHLDVIIASPIDFRCLSRKLARRLAARLDITELDSISDAKDKVRETLSNCAVSRSRNQNQRVDTARFDLQLVSRLYMHKLERFLSHSSHTIFECEWCGQLYGRRTAQVVHCARARPFVDAHGAIVAQHRPNPHFQLKKVSLLHACCLSFVFLPLTLC